MKNTEIKKVTVVEKTAEMVKGSLNWVTKYIFSDNGEPNKDTSFFKRYRPESLFVIWVTDYKGDYGKYLSFSSFEEAQKYIEQKNGVTPTPKPIGRIAVSFLDTETDSPISEKEGIKKYGEFSFYSKCRGIFENDSNWERFFGKKKEYIQELVESEDDDNYDFTFCLFEGRHELPTNKGAIFSSFDFGTMRGEKTMNYDLLLKNGGQLYVTGLTPALTQFLSDFTNQSNKPTLVLLHFNNSTKQYVPQFF